ncbi:MAG: flagellar basal body P-ring formation chaperone FlgA [Pirellulales bacterium]
MHPILRRLSLTSLTSLAAFGALTFVVAADIVVQARGEAAGPVIRLGDVCQIIGNDGVGLEGLELGPAPVAGGRKVWRAREIQDRLTVLGVNLSAHRFGGASQAVIGTNEVKTKQLPKANTAQRTAVDNAVATVVEKVLSQSASGRLMQVEPLPTDEMYAVLPTGATMLKVVSPVEPRVGKQTIQIETTGRDPRRMAIEIDLTEAPLTVAVVRSVPRGAIITAADVELRPRDEKVVRASYETLDEVVGREAAQALVPGQTLDTKTVRNHVVVRKGDVVDVSVHSGGVRIGAKGRSRGDGGVGDLVQIELLHNKQALLARVSGLQAVQVMGGADR